MGAIEDAIIVEAELVSELVDNGDYVDAALVADSIDDAVFGSPD